MNYSNRKQFVIDSLEWHIANSDRWLKQPSTQIKWDLLPESLKRLVSPTIDQELREQEIWRNTMLRELRAHVDGAKSRALYFEEVTWLCELCASYQVHLVGEE